MTWKQRCLFWINSFFLCTIFSVSLSASDRVDSLYTLANDFYQAKKYNQSIQLYQQLIQEYQIKSPELYYNLGTAFLKEKDVAHAVLYLEKATKFKPFNKDFQANLGLARALQTDDVGNIPDFFLKRWVLGMARVFNSTIWAILSIILFIGTCVLFVFWMFHNTYSIKRIVFWSAVMLFSLTSVAVLLGVLRQNMELTNPYAIVMVPEESLKMAPENESKEVITIHAGLKVRVIDQLSDWSKVELSNKEVGWILTEQIERI